MRYIVLLIVAVCALLFIYAVTTGLDARATPGALETTVFRAVRAFSIPRAVRNQTDPAPSDAAAMHDAMAHFADHCASCHGADGSGDTEIGRGLYPKPPDMRQSPTQRLTDGELFYIVEHGVRFTGMPGFGTGTAEGARASWSLVRLIRQLPGMTPDQVEHIRTMVPRSPDEIRREMDEDRFLAGGQ